MTELHFPFLEATVLLPLLGAAWVSRIRDPQQARRHTVGACLLTLAAAVGAWQDFHYLHVAAADDRWHLMTRLFGRELLQVDLLSAPLLPLAALLYLLTVGTTTRTKAPRFSFVWALISAALLLATLACKEPWGIVGLLALATLPPYFELRARNRPTRVYVIYMGLFVTLLVGGWAVVVREGAQHTHSLAAIVPLLLAVLIRAGMAPTHSWITDLFENATFGTALLVLTPLAAAYATVRLVLPIAPDWVLRSLGNLSLLTAVYSAGMALVQTEARQFFAYLFLSHSALVFVGLEAATPIGLTGALCVWLSVGMALGGFGLTLRALEGRRGRLSLQQYQGAYEHAPTLAVFFLLTGLASVGFPGTVGFIGTEMLVDGAVAAYPFVGVAVVIAAALNGIAMVRAYFLLFTGTRLQSAISLQIRRREQWAVVLLAALIFAGGILPQPGIASRYEAAQAIIRQRQATGAAAGGPHLHAGGEDSAHPGETAATSAPGPGVAVETAD